MKKIILAVLIFSFAACLFAAAGNLSEINLKIAKELYDSGDYQGSIDKLYLVIKSTENETIRNLAYFYMAKSFDILLDIENAVKYYSIFLKKASATHPKYKSAQNRLKFLKNNIGYMQEENGTEVKPPKRIKNPEPQKKMAIIEPLLLKEKYYPKPASTSEAKNEYPVFELNNKMEIILNEDGVKYMKMGLYEKAEDAFRKAIYINPQDATAYNNLAFLYADLGIKLDEAFILANRALKLIKKNQYYIYDTIGWIYYQKRDYDLAVKYLEKANYGLRPVVFYHLAKVYISKKEYQKAEENLKKVLNFYSDAKLRNSALLLLNQIREEL